jgi:CBS domain containing-hemolysin-like protein
MDASDLSQPSRRPLLSKFVSAPLLRLVHFSPRPKDAAAEAASPQPADVANAELAANQQALIRNVIEFGATVAREVMVPRPEVFAIDEGLSLEEIVKAFEASGYSRLPVFRGTLDEVVGVLHSKDLLPVLLHPEGFRLERLIHEPFFVPGNAPLQEVLRLMQTRQGHFAIVVDEHGVVEGILTLEDLLEEIVGEINDEHDDEGPADLRIEVDGTIVLVGSLAVRDLNRRLGVELPESDAYTSVAGLLMARAGRLLAPGDLVAVDALVFTVEEVEGRRVTRVRMERPDTDSQG